MNRSLASLGVLWGLTSCAPTGPSLEAEPSPRVPDYRERLLARLEEAKAVDPPRFRVRMNRAPCECPPREIQLSDRWYRVEIVADPQDPSLLALLAAESVEPPTSPGLRVEGEPSLSPQACGRGALVVSLRLVAYVPDEGAPSGSDR